MLKYLNTKNTLLAILFFFLPCAFSYPGRAYYWLVKLNDNDNIYSILHTFLIPSIVWSLVFLCMRLNESERSLINRIEKDWQILSALGVWFVTATISYLVNPSDGDIMVTYSACYLACPLLYLALRNIKLTRNDINIIFLALSVGCLFPLLLGIMQYYREWGIPGPHTLLYSRYDLVRMSGYCAATFGNTSNTAPFLLLIGLPLFTMVLDSECGKLLRIWFFFVLILTIVHLLIVQSRASILCFFISLGLIMYHKRLKKEGLILAVILLLIFLIPILGSFHQFMKNLTAAATADTHDNSVYERTTAMKEAWRAFLMNWQFGIGPGATISRLSFDTAHQFFIQQAAELGILGLVSSVCLALIVLWRTFAVVISDFRKGFNKEKFTFLIGPFGFTFYAIISNAPLNIGVVNTFIGLFTAYLALAGADFGTESVVLQESYLPSQPGLQPSLYL